MNLKPYHILTKIRATCIALLTVLIVSCESPAPTTPVAVDATREPKSTPIPTTLTDLDKTQYLKAVGYIKNREAKKAEKILVKLLQDYGTNPSIITNLATSYLLQKKIQQAKNTCKLAEKNALSIPEIHNILGLIAVEEKDFATAEAEYATAIKLDKAFANAHYNLALLYDIYYQDIPKAYKQYQQYIALRPGDTDTKNWLEQLQYSLQR